MGCGRLYPRPKPKPGVVEWRRVDVSKGMGMVMGMLWLLLGRLRLAGGQKGGM